MIRRGTPLTRHIYGVAAIGLQLSLLVGCISIPTASLPEAGTRGQSILPAQPGAHPQNQSVPVAALQPSEPALFPASANLEQQLMWTFNRARALVEQETGVDLSHVTVRISDEGDIQEEVKRVTEKLVSEQFNNRRYAEHFLNKIVGDQKGTYAALYVDSHQQVLVSHSLLNAYLLTAGKHDKVYPALLALLIHELVHAADDVVYGINKNRVLSFKASFTQSATFEGHAQYVTRKICSKNNCLDGMAMLEKFMFETTQSPDPVAQSVQAISRNVLEYSYIEGERFVTELAKRPNGAALIDHVLRHPPDDPVQILVPDTYPDTARETRNRLLFAALQPGDHVWSQAPWKLVETSPIKGIDVRNDPQRRIAAVEGFTKLIVSMTGAQLYNQSSMDVTPIDIMLIEAENPSTAKLFAESFVNRSANSLAGEHANAAVQIDRFENQGAARYSLYQVTLPDPNWPAAQSAAVIGVVDQFVVQISASMLAKDSTLQQYARLVMRSVARISGQS